MVDPVRIDILTGRDPALNGVLPALARLRIEVFHEFPYLYAGSLEYEQKYLTTYTRCPDSVVVLARDGEEIVGASTGLPLQAETPEVQQPFIDHGFALAEVFYCGESVLRQTYRGRGLYKAFFKGREDHARALGGFRWMALCGVVRAADHPRRPSDYAPLDAVWERFGYRKYPELITHFDWQDLDETSATPKEMVFWLKALA
ncbi:MAG: GNAT family N-acetyltransferase [Gammaproteobacteria bacterium]|nr:GNAT family N-acetyltransferase [Gammaproteobacteria bacterium]